MWQTSPQQTLLVNSQTRGKAVSKTGFKGQSKGMHSSGDTLTSLA
jgi:hypothetical protein